MFRFGTKRLVTILYLLLPLWAHGADVYVSTSGNNTTGDGSAGNPYLTITKAVQMATAGDTIIVRTGTYRELVDITKRLTIRAYKDGNGVAEAVTISALEAIQGWTLDSGSIYKAEMNWELVPSTDADDDKRGFIQHQVFVNDGGNIKSLVHARWPNLSYTKATTYTYNDVAHMAAGSGKKDTANYVSDTMAWFTNDETHIAMPAAVRDLLPGALITYQPATMCFSRTNKIPSTGAFDDRNAGVSNEVTISAERLQSSNASSLSDFSGPYEYPNIGCGYHVWGKKEFLDTAGEWYRQPSGTASDNGMLYVWMPDGAAPGARIEAKRRMKTVNIGVMNEAENPSATALDGIVLEDLTFLGGGITVSRNSDNLTIRRCTFRHTSHLDDGGFKYTARWERRTLLLASSGSLVEDCNFYDSENGVELNGRSNTVRNCVFQNIGADFLGQAVMSSSSDSLSNDGSLAQRNLVEKSTFVNSGYTAIQIWKGLDAKYNDVSGTHRRGNDVGAISMAPEVNAYGAEVAYNFVHDSWAMPRDMANDKVFYGAHGIYSDRNGTNLIIHHNVIWNMSGPELAVLKSGTSGGTSDSGRIADHNTVHGEMSMESGGDTVTFRNNISENTVTSAAGLTMAGNLGYAPGTAGWVDADHQDYRLSSTSRAIDAGVVITGITASTYAGNSPDAGAYEGLADWSTLAGATASAAQVSAATLTVTAAPNGLSASIALSGLPVGRKLPKGTLAKIGGAGSGGTLVQSVNSETGAITATLSGVPADGTGGNQAIQLSVDGGSTWLPMGTANVDGSKITGSNVPAGGMNPSTGATLTLTGQGFVKPTPTTYERTVTISNPANSDLFDYPVLVTLDTAAMVAAGQCQADGRDLRFRAGDGTNLSYWIESGMNTSSTKVWVRMPKVAAAGSSVTLVSGDSSLSAASSGTAVFSFFDDFSSGSMKSDWTGASTQTDSKGNTATVSVAGGELVISGSIVNGIDYGAAFGVSLPTNNSSFYPAGRHIIESRVRVDQSGGATSPPSTVWKASVGGDLAYMGVSGGQVAYYNSGWQNQSATTLTGGASVTMGYAVDPSDGTATGSLWFFENGVQKATRTSLDFVNSWNNPSGRGAWTFNPQASGAFSMRVDDVRVRPWVSAEPVATVGGSVTTVAGAPLTATLNGSAVTATWVSETELSVVVPAILRSYSATESLAVTCGGITLPVYSLAWSTGQTPLEQWRYSLWSTIRDAGDSADLADPDGDGIRNLLEYGLGSNPKVADLSGLPVGSAVSVSGNDRLRLEFTRQARTDLTYVVEASSDLSAWTQLWQSSGAENTNQMITVTDTVDLTTSTARFIRLRVSSP